MVANHHLNVEVNFSNCKIKISTEKRGLNW
jgi:hypothetical protein